MALAALILACVCSAPPDQEKTELPAGVLARVNGETISAETFQKWLLHLHGPTYVNDYLGLVVLRQEAARLGIEVTEADTEAALGEDWKNHVMRYGGDEKRWLQELASGGMDRGSYQRSRLATLEAEILAKKLVPLNRTDDETTLRQLHVQEFGTDGIRTHLQVAFFDKFRDLEGGKPIRDEALVQALDRKARERAEGFVAEVSNRPEDFGKLARELSDTLAVPRGDGWTKDLREDGGDLPRYTKTLFAGALEETLAGELTPGQLLGPILSHRGYYVIRFVLREAAPYEEVQAELVRINRERPATPREVHALKTRLLEEAKIQVTTRWPPDQRP
ncbi:MAG: peptidylprolyl isomerase [Planctomycetota bacterium]